MSDFINNVVAQLDKNPSQKKEIVQSVERAAFLLLSQYFAGRALGKISEEFGHPLAPKTSRRLVGAAFVISNYVVPGAYERYVASKKPATNRPLIKMNNALNPEEAAKKLADTLETVFKNSRSKR